MTLLLADYASYQAGLRVADLKMAGFRIINFKISHGMGRKAVPAGLPALIAETRRLGLGICTFHWLDGSATGIQQAGYMLAQLAALGLDGAGVGHICDCESTATRAIWTDYVTTVMRARRRPVGTYTGDWWWAARKGLIPLPELIRPSRDWAGAASLTPYLHAAPNDGYLPGYPGDTSAHWSTDRAPTPNGYGGWHQLSIMQYRVAKVAGVAVSQSAIRDPTVWAGLTGGDGLVPAPDPGNAPPEAWSIPMTAADITAVRSRLDAEAGTRAELIDADEPAREQLHERRERALIDLGGAGVAFQARGEVCAPAISADMADWVALGGGNSGCVGNAAHTYGFHRGADYVPATDYSRRRDPNGADGPYTSGNYACAGDYGHAGKAALRARHAALLDRLMHDDPALRMVCEMITMPWSDRPVMYWARWEGVTSLRRYTGVGHDTWSHVSVYRSKADQRPYLWRNDMALSADDKAYIASFFNLGKQADGTPWSPVGAAVLSHGIPNPIAGGKRTPAYTTLADISTTLAATGKKVDVNAATLTEADRKIDAVTDALTRIGGGGVDVDALADAFVNALPETAADRVVDAIIARIRRGTDTTPAG